MQSVEQVTAAWKVDREAREHVLALTVGERDRYRSALHRIARSDPGSYFGAIAAEALRHPSDELASLEEWGSAG